MDNLNEMIANCKQQLAALEQQKLLQEQVSQMAQAQALKMEQGIFGSTNLGAMGGTLGGVIGGILGGGISQLPGAVQSATQAQIAQDQQISSNLDLAQAQITQITKDGGNRRREAIMATRAKHAS